MTSTKKERKKITNKGKRWLLGYLKHVTTDMQEENQTKIISTVCSLYRREMRNNDAFFSSMEEFCSEARSNTEKNRYFSDIMTYFAEDGRLRESIAKRYPEEFH